MSTRTEPVTIILPWPPSENRYRRTIRMGNQCRPIISREGRAYRKAVQSVVLATSEPWPLLGRLAVEITACPPDRRRRDLDNVLKATLDALEHAGVYEDDYQIDDLHIMRGCVVKGGELLVQLRAITAEEAAT